MSNQRYQPGVCNIGAAERNRRRQSGVLGMVIAFVWTFLGYFFTLPVWYKMLVFFPCFAAAIGFFQYYFKFCAYFGLANIFNFGELGKKENIVEVAAKKLDRKKAWKIIILSFAVSLLYTVIVLLLF